MDNFGMKEPKRVRIIDISQRMLDNVDSNLFLALENEQITGSHKYRLAYGMLSSYLETHSLNSFTGFAEFSSGNTGLALAELTNQINKPLQLFIVDAVDPKTKSKLIEYKNVTLRQFPTRSKATKAMKLFLSDNKDYVHLNQYDNFDGVKGFTQLGRELLEELPIIDTLVMGVGTGATIQGIALAIPHAYVVAGTIKNKTGTIQGWRNVSEHGAGDVLLATQNYVNKWVPLMIGEIVSAKADVEESLGYEVNYSTVANLLIASEVGRTHNVNIITLCTGR